MESGQNIPAEDIYSGIEYGLSEVQYEEIKTQVAIALSKQKFAETSNDLIRYEWLLEKIVDRVMSALEEMNMEVDEGYFARAVAYCITELMPEGSPEASVPRQDDEGDDVDFTGTREPRNPLPSSDGGSIELETPRQAA